MDNMKRWKVTVNNLHAFSTPNIEFQDLTRILIKTIFAEMIINGLTAYFIYSFSDFLIFQRIRSKTMH